MILKYHTGNDRLRKGWGRSQGIKKNWRKSSLSFQCDENYQAEIHESCSVISSTNTEKTTPTCIVIKLLKISDKAKSEKHPEKLLSISSHSIQDNKAKKELETMQARRQWNFLQVLRENLLTWSCILSESIFQIWR